MDILSKLKALFRDPPPQVVVHDPAAAEPRNLDDTFFDEKAQERVGKAIASATKPSSN